MDPNQNLSFVAMVNNISLSKNNNYFIEVEDLTSRTKVIVSNTRQEA